MTAYKPISADRRDVVHAKQIYGIWYGASLGFFFAFFTWGLDAYHLSQVNSLHPWLKFAVGALLCTAAGGLTGWLAARRDKPILALLLWLVFGFFLSWLVVILPIVIFPRLLGLLEPEARQFLHYVYYPEFSTRIGVAFAWIIIFVAIAGLLQLPLSEGAVFSTSVFGRIAPILVGLIMVAIAGTIVDGLNNELLRTPIEELNATIQFAVDHKGQHIDAAESRKMRQASLRTVQDLISPDRKLLVSGYDAFLGEVNVLVKFDKAWVECQVLYNQPVNCKQVGTIP
ncbi:MAG: hypothetical protein ACM3XO_24960 [Bacteroidota bacterium]|jgi:hypothetical protein